MRHFLERVRARHSRSQGQSVVELVLILPVFLLLLLITVDLGRLLYSQITITSAAKEGALVASQGGTFQSNQVCSDTNTVMCGVLTEAKGGFVEVDKAKVTLTPAACVKDAMYPASGTPPNVAVAVQAPFKVLSPIVSSIVGSNLVLGATASAQCLVVPRVTYPSIPNPTAAFTANPTAGRAPLTVNFDGSGSSSPGATITRYSWNFEAGSLGTGVTTSKSYTAAGTYSVTLTVTDSRNKTATSSAQTITVTSAPPPPCPTVSFTATDSSSNRWPRRMDLKESVSDGSGGWTWTWTGAVNPSQAGQNLINYDFASGGPQSVTLSATKATPAPGCSITTTQTVNVP
ncbi:MAG: PKD domain-containing protein [Chloroflexi bacterium]|nr:PKD domain-containing protein [Chloroflexota bacterium]